MANITVVQECSNGVWNVEVLLEGVLDYETGMTSSELTEPATWSSIHLYSVSSNSTKTFWTRNAGILTSKTVTFGFCVGIQTTTTQTVSPPNFPIPQIFNCQATFILLPLFLDVRNKLQAIPNPIHAINATCKCDVLRIEIIQAPTKGTLISSKLEGSMLNSINFEDMSYLVNNVNDTGKDIIKYVLHTTCGDSPVGTIEIKLI